MSWQAVIVDTNVVVAGLITRNDTSPVARILDGMLGAAFPFVLSEALLAEYRAVLVRPVLRKLHGLTVAEVEAILTDLATAHGRWRLHDARALGSDRVEVYERQRG